MKLVIAIVQADDAGEAIAALTERELRVTRLNTAGGFLRQGNVTLLIGIRDDQLGTVLSLLESHCHTRSQLYTPPVALEPEAFYLGEPIEVQVGGATVFVIEVLDLIHL
jgi:uncharacterized protein YaaQ